MPRFFFDIHDAQGAVADEEGTELPDLEAVAREAISAKELTAESAKQGTKQLDRWFEIQNEKGEIVLIVNFADAIRDRPSRS